MVKEERIGWENEDQHGEIPVDVWISWKINLGKYSTQRKAKAIGRWNGKIQN